MADLTPEQEATLERWRNMLAGENGPQADNTYVPDPEDAHSFYQFSGGVPYKMPCPHGLIFNPELSVCDWPMAVSLDVNPAPRSES